uniref:Uncharacterized protein n=1 Tax=Fagus sylvatica TaxID=28930 RepID=A0A2N9I9R6_FAGSY
MASTPSGQPDRTKPTTTRKLRVVAKTRTHRRHRGSPSTSRESVRASQFREAASGAGAGYGGERGRERGGEEGEGRDEGVRVGEEHAVPSLAVHQHDQRGKKKKTEMGEGDMSGAWWGKNKKKGREGGYVGGGGKKGKEKK